MFRYTRYAARWTLGAFALLFLFAAYVQLNDADPLVWTAIYLAAAHVAVFGAADRLPIRLGALATLAPAIGGLVLAWQLATAPSWTPMYPERAETPVGLLETEKGREMFGLFLIAAASSIAWWTSANRGESSPSDETP